jgi:hypothetical protein
MEKYPSVPTDQSIVSMAHRQAMQAPLSEVAGLLQEVLTRRLTTYLCGVKDGKTILRWASGEVTEIRQHETEQKLRAAYEIVQLLLQFDAPTTIRAWFIGMSPELDDMAPAEVIRAGQLKDAMGAARAFIAHG